MLIIKSWQKPGRKGSVMLPKSGHNAIIASHQEARVLYTGSCLVKEELFLLRSPTVKIT
jgi:hypothetical protein